MMGLEFVLVARLKPLAAPFGQDALLQFHRQIGYVGLAFILGHFAISAQWHQLTLTKALHAPLLVWFGMAALLALVVLVLTSAWRRPFRLSYEARHFIHAALALVLVVGALGHVLFVDEYVGSLWKQVLWALMSAVFAALIVWVRVVKPSRARPWRLARVTPERGDTTTLTLEPPERAGFPFAPGQFGWFATETFAEVELALDSWRWAGARLRLRTGEAIGRDREEVVAHFRPVPHSPFAASAVPNRLRFGLDPEGLTLELTGTGRAWS